MGSPSPELKQLWIRVLKRVHPDLAIDEPDRIRCERLTQLANEAYQAGNVEALRAVLEPSQPPNAGAARAYARSRPPLQALKRFFQSWFWLPNGTAFSFKQLLPVAIAIVILVWRGFSFYSITTSLHAVTNSSTAQVDSVTAPIQAHVEVPDGGIWQLRPSNSTSGQPYQLQDRRQAPLETSPPVADSVEPSQLYMKQMRERLYQSFSNYERVDAKVPPGNSSETWFDVNRDGSLSNVRVGKPSGWASLDYACVRAVQRTETVGALPEDYKLHTLPATFACSYTGSNALLTSSSVDSATDRPDLYVGSVRNTTH